MTPSRVLRAMVWTALLCTGLFALDRWWLGPTPLPTLVWRDVADVESVPGPRTNVVTPPYLPSTLVWPPARVLHQGPPEYAWWLGLRGEGEGSITLWMGVGQGDVPDALGEVARCLEEDATRCPPGWHALSTQLRDGRMLRAAGHLETEELERVVSAMARSRAVR